MTYIYTSLGFKRLTDFCQVSFVLISFPWVILSKLAYVCVFLLSTVFHN